MLKSQLENALSARPGPQEITRSSVFEEADDDWQDDYIHNKTVLEGYRAARRQSWGIQDFSEFASTFGQMGDDSYYEEEEEEEEEDSDADDAEYNEEAERYYQMLLEEEMRNPGSMQDDYVENNEDEEDEGDVYDGTGDYYGTFFSFVFFSKIYFQKLKNSFFSRKCENPSCKKYLF